MSTVSHSSVVVPALLDALGIDWRYKKVAGFVIDGDSPHKPVTVTVRYIITDEERDRLVQQLKRFDLVEKDPDLEMWD